MDLLLLVPLISSYGTITVSLRVWRSIPGIFKTTTHNRSYTLYWIWGHFKHIIVIYWGNSIILTVHILAIGICSFIIISTSIATVLHLLTRTTHQTQTQWSSNYPKLTHTASDVSTSYSITVYMWLTSLLTNSNYKGSYLLVHMQVSIAKSILLVRVKAA